VTGTSEDFPRKLLFPSVFRIIGLILFLGGAVAAFLRFSRGMKPGFLDVNVFAVYSMYFDTKYFRIIGNNISEEIAGILLLAGVFLFTFAREKKESPGLWYFRTRAFLIASYINTGFLILSFIFIYGLGFLFILCLNMFSLMIIYNLCFRYLLYKSRKTS
jgi:hypothetical protein